MDYLLRFSLKTSNIKACLAYFDILQRFKPKTLNRTLQLFLAYQEPILVTLVSVSIDHIEWSTVSKGCETLETAYSSPISQILLFSGGAADLNIYRRSVSRIELLFKFLMIRFQWVNFSARRNVFPLYLFPVDYLSMLLFFLYKIIYLLIF